MKTYNDFLNEAYSKKRFLAFMYKFEDQLTKLSDYLDDRQDKQDNDDSMSDIRNERSLNKAIDVLRREVELTKTQIRKEER